MKELIKKYFFSFSDGENWKDVTQGGVFMGLILFPLAFPIYLTTIAIPFIWNIAMKPFKVIADYLNK